MQCPTGANRQRLTRREPWALGVVGDGSLRLKRSGGYSDLTNDLRWYWRPQVLCLAETGATLKDIIEQVKKAQAEGANSIVGSWMFQEFYDAQGLMVLRNPIQAEMLDELFRLLGCFEHKAFYLGAT